MKRSIAIPVPGFLAALCLIAVGLIPATPASAAADCCDITAGAGQAEAAPAQGHEAGHDHDHADGACPSHAADYGASHDHGHDYAHGACSATGASAGGAAHKGDEGHAAGCCDDIGAAPGAAPPSTAPPRWSAAVIDTFERLPVQDGGRVKPLKTLARFKLLQLSGRTTIRDVMDRQLTATEWLLDALFWPEYAEHNKVFLVQSPEVMDTLGLAHETMRERFSYADLRPARERLFQLAQQASHMERTERTRVQEQLIHLAHNAYEFELLTHFFAFARRMYPVGESETLREVFDGATAVTFSEAVLSGPELIQALVALRQNGDDGLEPAARQAEVDRAAGFFRQLERVSETAAGLALFPPGASAVEEAEWSAPGELLLNFFHPPAGHEEQARLLADLEALARSKENPETFSARLESFHDGVTGMAAARGEYRAIPLEVTYYRLSFLDYALYLYVLAFVLTALAWMRPHNRLLWWAAFSAASLPLALHTAAIIIRCVIRARPPVTTLYETIIFTAAVAVLCALVIEYINRRRIGLGMAASMGTLGLFLAYRYEVQEGVDTMPALIAVLDTNFWLSIHVITMVMGYAGSLLAAATAHLYLFGKALGIAPNNKDFYKSVARMTYGAICFGLLFNMVGTVIGGLWAAESWGRFWGWDPKENGALIVVLWGLIIVHARRGGYIKDYGVQMAAVFGAITVAFAWFGVNLLGVGLHSYGFTDGVHGALMSFYALQSFVLFVGAAGWLRVQGFFRIPARTQDVKTPARPLSGPRPADTTGPRSHG